MMKKSQKQLLTISWSPGNLVQICLRRHRIRGIWQNLQIYDVTSKFELDFWAIGWLISRCCFWLFWAGTSIKATKWTKKYMKSHELFYFSATCCYYWKTCGGVCVARSETIKRTCVKMGCCVVLLLGVTRSSAQLYYNPQRIIAFFNLDLWTGKLLEVLAYRTVYTARKLA